MKRTDRRTNRGNDKRAEPARRDALRVLIALVCILFASIASSNHETPEKILERQAIADDRGPEQQQQKRQRDRDTKQLSLPSVLSRISGSISGAI